MSEPDEAAITRLLAEHDGYTQINPGWHACKCAVWITGYDSAPEPDEAHRAHVAAVLAAHMADREAAAWDAGYETGSTDCARFLGWATSEVPDARPKDRSNPFRLTPDTEGETE